MERKGVVFQGRRTVIGLLVFVFTTIFSLPVFAASITIQWDPSPDPNVVGYNFYYGAASRNYTNIIDVGNATTATISNLVEGTTYYFAATAYNILGIESVFSDELSYTVPLPANNPPTLNAISNVTLNEDVGSQTVSLAGIGTGAANETQTLTVTATSSNPGLIPNPTVSYTSPNSTGSLSFTPVANANGTATITVTVNDGQAQNNTFSRTFTVTVNAVNDVPTFNTINNITLNEDSGLQTVSLTGIGTGAANETQTLTVTATSSNPGLIPNPTVTYTSPNATGTLSFTPVANASGTATITVTANDGQTQNNLFSRTFTVTVNALNDAPTLNAINNVSVNEDAAAQTVNLSGIGTGAASETQTLTVTATSSNPTLIPNPTVTYTSPNATGSLSLTPVANANGTATITVTVNDGQAQNNTFSRTFTVTVNALNDAPTLIPFNNLTLSEDAGLQTVTLAGITTGATNETQTLAVTATSSNPGLIPNPTVTYTSPNSTGSLSFTPVANANGTATITVTVNDGQAQNNTFSRTFTVTVDPVNDAPTLNAVANVGISENAGLQTVNLAGIGTGAANETQTLTVTATSSNPGLIPNPTVTYTSPNATGTLSFAPVANANGTATITVTVNDAQTQNSTVTRIFTVTVDAFVNTTPTLSAINNVSFSEDAAAQTVNLSGIGSGSASETQTLTVTATSSNPTLIPNPTVSYTSPNATGSLSLTPAANANGTATITVTVNDGQAQNNTFSRTFTVTVNALNDAPTLDALSPLTLNEDAGLQTVSLAGIGTGAANETQTLAVTATSSNPTLIPNPTVGYTSPNSTGSLSFTPAANASGTATITVTVNDGQTLSNLLTRTFTVTVNTVNDTPTLNALSNLSLNENAGLQTVSLAGIGTGAANETQTLAVTATSSNPALIPNPTVSYTSPNSSGSLSFTPVASASGTATITVTVNDGQTQNNTVTRTFTITVEEFINTPPTLNAINNVSVNEDAAAQTVNLSGIGTGAASETQTLTVTATSSNPTLIPNPTVSYTSPNATGSLSLTPAANANGTATITVTVNDGQAQNNTFSRTFTVTVNALNDAPTLDALSPLTLNEDAGLQTVSLAGIGTGAANETQTLAVTATSSNPTLIPNPTVGYTSPNSTGSLSFTPAANASGTATITVTVNDGQTLSNLLTRTFTVTVNTVNDTPTLNALSNLSLNENAGLQTVSLAGIGTGAANETQTLAVTATSSNPALIPNPTVSYTSPNSSGSLSFTPVASASGSATITVTVNDGQAQNNTFSRTFTVSVNDLNDAPTLNAINNVSVNEDAAAQTVNLSGIGTGAASETQTLTVTATSSNPTLIPNPTVTYTSPNATGSLSLTPVANANGTATITVTVNDGQAQNNTFSRTFTVTVNALNDAPTLIPFNNLTLSEDAGLQTVTLAGITTGATNETQTLAVTATSSNPGLIPNPTVTYTSPNSTGSLSFTPVANANGTATITVTVNDGQAQNNTFSRTFTVTVDPVNDAPTLNGLANVGISENAGLQTVNLAGIGTGAANETQTLTVTATSSNPGLIPNPAVTYTSPNATGSLSFTPVAGENGSATITVTVNDAQTQNSTVTRIFTVTVDAFVNTTPTLSAINNVSFSEDAAAQTVNLSGIGSGSASETQTLTVTATSSNPTLIPNPTVTYTSPNATGSLSLTPAANANGTATITVTVNDGQAQNNTFSRTFTVTVNALNDAPTLDALSPLTLNEDAGLQTVSLAGIGTGAANETQTLAVTATSSNPTLIPNPTVGYTSPNSTGSLSFTPAANASGTATITVTVNDGQTLSNLLTRTFTVTVNTVNDTPTLNALSNLSLNENAGLQTVSLAGIGTGAANETQTLAVTATSSNPALIPNPTVSYTSPNSSGSLSFTPVASASGSATITVTVNDGQAQNNTFSRTFTVSVNDLNDAPTLSALSNLTLNEDAGLQTVNLAGISSGSTNEAQTLTVTATSSNPTLIPNPTVTYTSPNSTGSLSFTPAANASGTATLTVTVNDGQAQNNTFSRTFTVTVNALNDAPTLIPFNNLTLSEDAGLQTVTLAGITTGATNETQTLAVTATSSNPGLIPNPTVTYTSPNSTGSLSFTPVANANGTATITVTVNDGQAQNNTFSRTFTVTVDPVNDAPTLNAVANVGISENAGLQTVNLAGIGTGAANETQTLTVTATSSNPGLIPNPTVTYTSPNATGTLSFAPVANANGTATITVTVNDAQTQNNIVTRTFDVGVAVVNRLPIISAITNIIIPQNTATSEIPFTINDVETALSNLTLTATSSNPALVGESGIVFGGSDGSRTVTITPLPDRGGDSDITITVSDGSATASTTFLLTVLGPPAPPSALTIVTNGIGSIYGAPTAETVKVGQIYTITATAGEGQMFAGWTGSTNSHSSRLTIAARSNMVLRANFVPLNLTTNGSGTVTPNLKKTQNLVVGRSYTVTAAGGPGNMFVGWTGSTNSTSPTLAFVMRTNVTLQANFVPLALSTNGNGTLTPDLRKTANLVSGRAYTVTAAGGPGNMFVGWTGSTNSSFARLPFVMNTNVSLQANFVPVNLTVNGSGTLVPDLRKTANLVPGKTYTIKATPGVGQEFAGWTGSIESLSPSLTFVMTTNLVLQANFIPSPYIPIAGAYNGLFYEADQVRRHSSGLFNVVVTTRGTYSGWVQTGFTRTSFTGKLALDCRHTNLITSRIALHMKLVLDFSSASQTDQVVGRWEEGNWVSTLSGDRAVFNATTNPSPYAGNYTLALPGYADDPSLPAGDGFGTVRVSASGQATFAGTLGDGTRAMQSASVSRRGNWPLHSLISYAREKGTLLGWMSFTNRTDDDLNGTLSWIKPRGPLDRYYPLGFDAECKAIGSIYRAPVGPLTNFVLNLTEAKVEFSGGNLISAFTNSILLGPNSKVSNLSGSPLTLTFLTTAGTFSGSVADPATLKPLTFKGAVFQKQNAGFGFLTGTNQTGRVAVMPPTP